MRRWLLTPAALAYAAAVERRIRRAEPVRVPARVVCVGGVSLGGAGKTPAVRALRAQLQAMGASAVTLSRGHGGRLAGPLRVDPAIHAWRDVGDEPLLHAQDGEAWIARDRVAGAKAAAAAGARLILLDDGFQNPTLAKDFSFLCIDAEAWFGNGAVFPAGPLRERVDAALARADALILTRTAAEPGPVHPAVSAAGRPILTARLTSASPPAGPLYAFAGLARPAKLLESLRATGAEVIDLAPFPDHHPYRPQELEALAEAAAAHGARLVTTEKDHARLNPAWRARVSSVPASLVFDDPPALDALLSRLAQP